ncbi:MAG: Cytochrome c oxidase polypeptide 4 [Microbacteriaceae bacterium]|nr:Cytochrome c oxidase polypeptide 4 [Microbacteriaceae bacterium]
MNANAKLFWILAVFFIVADAAYVVWSIVDHNARLAYSPVEAKNGFPVEWVGAVGIALTGVLSGFIAFYLGRTAASTGGVLAEDRPDAEIDDGDPEQGFFSPWSWWPIMLAAGAALLFLGIAVGVWIAFIGAAITVVSLVGWVYEYYRGNFAR